MTFHIDLNAEERQVLLETLEQDISDLSVEIADTDKMDYRTMLKGRRDALKAAMQKLREAKEAQAGSQA